MSRSDRLRPEAIIVVLMRPKSCVDPKGCYDLALALLIEFALMS